MPNSGGDPSIRIIGQHLGTVHKLALPNISPWEVWSAGEDGRILRYDFREQNGQRFSMVSVNKCRLPLYGIAAHPFNNEFCVCGRDHFVRIYDKRYNKKILRKLCPSNKMAEKNFMCNITSAIYNHDGTQILASYSDDDIYLFDNQDGTYQYKKRYQGHM